MMDFLDLDYEQKLMRNFLNKYLDSLDMIVNGDKVIGFDIDSSTYIITVYIKDNFDDFIETYTIDYNKFNEFIENNLIK